ncbi:AsmA-like C-terminal region-containing protein [Azonexus sp.]|uniref:AsmA-like C-terminal region-containing protein n=1 Tax=Azonexus sp. TaxID=1872668 RepID=UPI0027BAE457|nr:AsmA-like C-terminal region-containing protein [Azonexus sp.]
MNAGVVYAKTPIGEEAVRQSTRVVQRNLRMVLVQVDGKLSVGELSAKIGNANLVEGAICELEKGGYIVPLAQAESAWEMGLQVVRKEQLSASSQFSTFGSAKGPASLASAHSQSSKFSSFGKPVLPAPESSNKKSERVKVAALKESNDLAPSGNHRSLIAMIFAGLMAILLLCIVVAAFYPYQRHKLGLEQTLSAALQIPVKIDDVSLKLLPRPHLSLQGIRLGEGQGRLAVIQIHEPWKLILGGMGTAEEISVVDPVLPVHYLLAFANLTTAKPFSSSMLRRIAVSNLAVNTGASIIFGPLNGNLDFVSGKFSSATLETPERSLLLKALPDAAGIALSIEGRAWRPAGLPINFASLQAKGLLRADKLSVSEIDTTFLGGLLKGDWTLSWGSELSMSGMGFLARIDMRKVSADLAPLMNVEGDLSGTLRLQSRGADWGSLWRAATAQIDAEIVRGVIHGVNLGEAARGAAGTTVHAGITKFDKLNAGISIDASHVAVRNVQLDAGVMTATGQFVATREGSVDGRLLLIARSSVASARVPLALSGRLPNLTLVTEK